MSPLKSTTSSDFVRGFNDLIWHDWAILQSYSAIIWRRSRIKPYNRITHIRITMNKMTCTYENWHVSELKKIFELEIRGWHNLCIIYKWYPGSHIGRCEKRAATSREASIIAQLLSCYPYTLFEHVLVGSIIVLTKGAYKSVHNLYPRQTLLCYREYCTLPFSLQVKFWYQITILKKYFCSVNLSYNHNIIYIIKFIMAISHCRYNIKCVYSKRI